MKLIKVIIGNGQVEVSAAGFKGKGCLKEVEAVVEALGVKTAGKNLPEYFQQETTVTQQRAGR